MSSDGGSVFPGGKQGLLAELLAALLAQPEQPGRDEAAAFIGAAIMLGGGSPSLPPAVQQAADQRQQEFLDNPFRSKPVGQYTASEELKLIFKRDRFLQQPFGISAFRYDKDSPNYGHGSAAYDFPAEEILPAVRIAEALMQRPALLAAYEKYLRIG
mgnify:CR=1 FL=1